MKENSKTYETLQRKKFTEIQNIFTFNAISTANNRYFVFCWQFSPYKHSREKEMQSPLLVPKNLEVQRKENDYLKQGEI